jgi:hypothetical protein
LKLVREYVGEVAFGYLCNDNLTASSGVCHTHDYCDANVFMAAAMHYHGLCTCADLMEEDVLSPNMIEEARQNAAEFWNESWDVAKDMTVHWGREQNVEG